MASSLKSFMLVDDIAKFSKTLCITGDTDRGNEEDCLIEEPESLTDCEERWVTQGSPHLKQFNPNKSQFNPKLQPLK
jgi:hypothetical protein